jgi:flagellar basal body P-ring formation protein FlgA
MLRDKRFIPLAILVMLISVAPCIAASAGIESEIRHFVNQLYAETETQISFTQLPPQVRGQAKARGIAFSKVPDANGDGVCMVGVEGRNGRDSNVYVPFKVSVKRKIFVAQHKIDKGEMIRENDIMQRETYLRGSGAAYPGQLEDIRGRVAKKEIAMGDIISRELLEDHVILRRGELVSITAQNKRLVVQAKGTALDKGRLGDVVRVKSESGTEIFAKVIGRAAVAVDF